MCPVIFVFFCRTLHNLKISDAFTFAGYSETGWTFGRSRKLRARSIKSEVGNSRRRVNITILSIVMVSAPSLHRTGIGQRKCARGLNNAQLLVDDSTVRATNSARTSDLVANTHGIHVRLTCELYLPSYLDPNWYRVKISWPA